MRNHRLADGYAYLGKIACAIFHPSAARLPHTFLTHGNPHRIRLFLYCRA